MSVDHADPRWQAEFARLARAQTLAAAWPQQFLAAWKEGVQLAGAHFFSARAGTTENTKWHYCPDENAIDAGFGVLSGGEKRFLAAMVSFYNSEWGQQLLKRAEAPNICDLSAGLDAQRRDVIAKLFQTYSGW